MRIVIDTDQQDENRGDTPRAESERSAMVIDGGPAPAALLRRFGQIPETRAELEGESSRADEEWREGQKGESENPELSLNPLRQGEAVATHRDEGGGAAPSHEIRPGNYDGRDDDADAR